MRHLIMRLEAPLMAFGGETIDNLGVIRRFPSASMLTGLLANALGWRRVESWKHQELQARLIFAARIDWESEWGGGLTDFQTAQLRATDLGWTTWGRPEGRAGDAVNYRNPRLRYRDYHADMRVTVAMRLEPAGHSPTLDDLARSLRNPARPLFIGRKTCLPSAPVLDPVAAPWAEGPTVLAALRSRPLPAGHFDPQRAQLAGRPIGVALMWPDGEGDGLIAPSRTYQVTDERNWESSGLHGGGRLVHEAVLAPEEFPPNAQGGEAAE